VGASSPAGACEQETCQTRCRACQNSGRAKENRPPLASQEGGRFLRNGRRLSTGAQ